MAGRARGAGALTALYGAPPARADRVLASVPTRQSVWPDNGSQRLRRLIRLFDPDALLKPVFDYTPRTERCAVRSPQEYQRHSSCIRRPFDYAPVFRKRTNRINAAIPKSRTRADLCCAESGMLILGSRF